DVVSSLLKQIIYDAKAEFNPNGPTTRNYLTDTSRIGLEVMLRLPFEGRASDFHLIDTIDFNFEGVDELESGIIKVNSENGFPVDVNIQVFFANSAYEIIDSLFDDSANRKVIESALVDNNGRVNQSTISSHEIEVNRERLKNLINGRYAIIDANVNTLDYQDSTNVACYSNYRLDVNLGVKAKILID